MNGLFAFSPVEQMVRKKLCVSNGHDTGKKNVSVRLTAAVFIRAIGAVWLFIALVTSRDAGAVAEAFKLLRSTRVTRTLGG